MGRTPAGQTRERIFRWVQRRLLTGQPPTVREVQHRFEFRAVQTAREHLEALVAEGKLTKRPGRARGYGLPASRTAAPRSTMIPILGRVQAGRLSTAIEDFEGWLPVEGPAPRTAAGDGTLFGLRVRGESMTGAGIHPDDVVVVRKQPTAHSGEIVVALVGDEATVKRLRRRGRRIELHPENPDFDVLVPDPTGEPFRLLGKVVEVRRTLS
ncbi:MAG: transcriptional repressor LexA [Planctomycetota bacterium]|nr:transcriptional repressor LexA [Planctomycetota bacterium]